MFFGDKEEVTNALSVMQRRVCAYDNFFRSEPPSFCDCKYGYDKDSNLDFGTENTCCPELRTVVALLGKLSEEEYNEILFRE